MEDNRWFDECFDAIDQFIGILDTSGRIIKANRTALIMTGLNHSDVYQVLLWEIPWHVLNRQNRRAINQVVSSAARGIATRKEIQLHLSRQTTALFDFTVKPIQNGQDTPTFLIAEVRDITAYRRTSEALFQSQARFQTIFEEAGMGIVIKEVSGKMLKANPAFQAMLGYTPQELRGLDYLDITHSLDKKASRKLFNELVAGKRKNYSVEKRYLAKDGQTLWARMTASLVHGQEGVGGFVIGMVENITTQKQIEVELIELQQRLMAGREMERLKVAQDLHDGPLQEIIGVSYLVKDLENFALDQAGREQLQAIQASITGLTGSIRAICGELRPPTLVPFGLEKTILSHAREFQKAHLELEVSHKLAHDGAILPEHERIVLFRIYQESINNIIRHAQAKTVKIRFRLTAKRAILEIQDDGVGFDLPSHWLRLARQGHLGLVGAMERAGEVGGDLEVITAPGQGTLIRVTVPLKEDNANVLLDGAGKI